METETLQQDEQQLVVFDLSTEAYGVDIGAVREIIRLQDITRVPRTPEFVEGVINLRGKVIPVVDLRKRFGLPAEVESKENRIVVVDIGIVVEDDGRGIDPEKIRRSAVDKGIISADAAARLSDSEAVELIFAPGFSTAEQTTDISGRGVGMGIVKTNIESINGFVELDTKAGQGCKMTVMLPLTLATIQALLFSVDNTVYAVPLVYVLEAVNLEPGDVQTIEGNEVIRLRGTVVPLLRVSHAFKLAKGQSEGPEKTHVVVVRIADKLVGLAVDALRELQEITVKSLGNYMGDVKGIAGVSILGDGVVVLILDVPTLVSTSITKAGLTA